MKRILSAAALSLLAACGGGGDDTGQVSLTVVRVGELSFNAQNGGVVFPVTLAEGRLVLAELNLVDLDADEETPFLDAQTTYDFAAQAQLDAGTIEVLPTAFEQIHAIMGVDALGGEQLTLQMVFDVTLSDTTVVQGAVALAVEPGEEQEIDAAVNIAAGDQRALTLAFDPAKILNGIDFDALGANGDFVLSAGSGDAAIDAALATVEANLFTSFAFVQ